MARRKRETDLERYERLAETRYDRLAFARPLKWPIAQYAPDVLKSMDERELRQEYQRLRSMVNKRLKRMEIASKKPGGTDWTSTKTYRENVGKYKPLREISDTRELLQLLHDVARTASATSGSIEGMKAIMYRQLATLHMHGYTFVNEKNYLDFGKYMEQARELHLDLIYGSDDIADMHTVFREAGLDWRAMGLAGPFDVVEQNFIWWMDHRKSVENAVEKLKKTGETLDAKSVYEAIHPSKKRETKANITKTTRLFNKAYKQEMAQSKKRKK